MAMQNSPHALTMALDIQRFMDRPAGPAAMPEMPGAPPGAPIGQPAMNWFDGIGIGQPAMDWLGSTEHWCTFDEFGWH